MYNIQSSGTKKWNRAFFRLQLFRIRQVFTIIVFLTSILGNNTLVVSADSPAGIREGFESGWTDHAFIDANTNWYSANGVYVENDFGTGGTWGLSNSANIFTWMSHSFQWSDPALTGVLVGMDFQTNASSQFDDDRIGWMIVGSNTASDNFFGVQLDPNSGGSQNIEAYWDGVTVNDGGRTSIVTLTGLSANAWYRLRAEITKLTDTSAKIDVTLTALDAGGNPTSLVASGSIPDTSLLPDTTDNYKPKPGYFTATTMYPAFKNHNGATGNADNAYFEILTGTPPVQYNLNVTTVGNGNVTLTPIGGVYNENTIVTLTPVPNTGWEFDSWSGTNAGDLVDNGNGTWSITMSAAKEIIATFTELPLVCYALTLGHTGNGTTPTASPANSTGCSVGEYISGEAINLSGANPDSGWQIASWYGTSNNTSTANTNSLTMPANVASAGVNYSAIPAGNYALQFDGTDDYVPFGQATAELGVQTFTVEAWVYRTTGGKTMSSGGLGLDGASGRPLVYPVVTKGRGQQDTPYNVNMNYFLGITSTGVIGADFEDTATGLNHPVWGNSTVSVGAWHHIVATYDGRIWKLYLDGILDKTLDLGATYTPEYRSEQHAAIASALQTSGTLPTDSGYFAGVIDEARIWNVVRTQAEVIGSMNSELTSGTGLIGRWGMNEGTGSTTIVDSTAPASNGTLPTNGPTWVAGAPFNITPPALYTLTVNPSSNGSVTLIPAGGSYYAGTTVQLTAIPNSGYAFSGWSGDLSGTTNPASVTMTSNKAVAANFGVAPSNVTVRVNQGSDDAEQNVSTGATDLVSTDLELIYDTANQIVGIRFQNVQIPQGATIQSAYIEFEVDETTDVNPSTLTIYGQAADNSSTFTSTANNISSRTKTSASAAWSPVAWSTVDVKHQTSNISAVVQEIVGRGGWASGNAMVFIVEGTGRRVAESYEGESANAPLLVINYTTGAPTTPPAAPSAMAATTPQANMVHLAWTDNANNESGFELERSITGIGGTYSVLTTLPANSVVYDNNGLTGGQEYCYRVRAVNALGQSSYAGPVCATPTAPEALDFGSGSAYVSFGDPAALDLAQFTIETWFKREGTGVTTTTGSGGVTNAIPLVTKGRGEGDTSNVDMNYFTGIRASDNVLFADFEAMTACGSNPAGQNYPVIGTTPVSNNVWHHVAATFDGSTWRLYLDGNLETTLAVNCQPRSDSIQHAGLGAALNSTGVSEGHFDGVLDEARVWNYARTQAEIRSSVNLQITSPQTGLVARWALNDGGTTVAGSAGTSVPGTMTGTGYSWVTPGAPYNLSFNEAPSQPALVAPLHTATGVGTSPTLTVAVSDPESEPMDVTFYGRPAGGSTGENFTIVALPDTQFYSESYPATFTAQTQWIANNTAAMNIKYVAHLGDIVNVATTASQWTNADAAMDILDTAGIPYGVVPGNHDDSDGGTNFNSYFGVSRFSGKSFYGGSYQPNDNQNNYTLFSAGSMDFIVVNLDYFSPAVGSLNWADDLLKANSTRKAIVVSHDIVGTGNPASFSSWGQSIYTALSDNPNLFLMMNGHTAGEGQRKDGNIYSLLSDYQDRTPGGGNGWLRILEFSPSTDTISVKTYSPTLASYETDANSQFTLSYDMDPGTPFTDLGTVSNVASGGTASLTWSSLLNNTQYEWYAVASDGAAQTTSPTWNFTTASANTAPIADDQSVNVVEDTAQGIILTGSDAENNPLTFTVLTDPLHGTLSGTAPNLTYTPASNYNGPDSFTFKANDGALDGNIATISITVTVVNDAPVCSDVTLTTDEDLTGQTAPACTDVENDLLTYAVLSQPTSGTASVAGSTLEYIPANNFNGATSFTYKANDGAADSNAATVSVAVNAVNDLPVAVADAYTTAEDTQLNVAIPGVLGNDSDVEGGLTAIKVTDPAHGTLALNANGSFTYMPEVNYNGTDSFTYKVNDGIADGNTVTVTLTVTAVNNAPVLNLIPDQTVDEGSLLSFTAVATDPDLGDTLTFSLNSEPVGAVITTTGDFTWTPAETQGPNNYTFQVCVSDGVLNDCQDVNVTVYEVNVAPELGAIGNKSINEGSELTFTAGATDTDLPVNTLTYDLTGAPIGANITSGGVFTWTPTEVQGSNPYTLDVCVSDGTVSDCETITITVNEVNVAPVADSQSVSIPEDTALEITLTGLDTDVPSNTLTYAVVSQPNHGLLSGTAPTLTYMPAANFNGSDNFTFTINDGTVDSAVATVTITVNGVNDAPIAADDSSYVIGEDGALTVPAIAGVLNNDSDADSDLLTAIKVTEPAHGMVTLNADGSFTYIPVANYYGSDSFTYKANDGMLDSNIVTVTITVTLVNDAPVALAQALLTTVNTVLNITLTATDADLPADTLTFAVVSQPLHGLLTGAVPVLTYTPTANFKGVDSFAFTVNDGTEDSASAIVTIDVKAPECVSPANEIVAENCLAGKPPSEWDVSGAGDANIQGYATDISVNQGETIRFKVDTDASNYRLDIYRLGYYDGNGARFIATVNPSATLPQIQPACLFDGTDGINLVDCGNWSESASWAVPSSTVSGVYIAKLVREDATPGTSHMVFIVRDDDGSSDLLFQTSDTTWQAYNRYGGYSLYDGPGHAHKVSYNRPFTTRDAPTEDWVFNAEYPMIRWLEQNGYDVSYFTDLDTDRFGSELLEHKVFLSVGHDEYWSAGQRTAVEFARGAGVNLAFFSGNEIYWKTRWEPSTADGGNTPYRTLVSYKEGDAQGSEHYNCLGNFNCDPDPDTWTGLWRQNQTGHDGGQPENSLSGQISWGDTTTAIQVPAWAGGLRFWRNAGITTDTTLTANTLGYEFDWEQAAYASSYPAGRITFSDTTAVGKNHRLSLYRAPSGALVFGAGTVQWSWGLDSTHDRGVSTVDPRIQQATVNILSDMLAQPATLQAGLVPGGPLDTTVPTATIVSPADGATVPGGNITITGTAADVGGLVALIEISTDGGTTWSKATGTTNWTYTFNAVSQSLAVQARAVDDAANIGTPVTINITIGTQTCPCSIWTPATLGGNYENDTNPVELGVKFRSDEAGYITGIRFWKASGVTGTHIGHLWTAGGTQLGEVTFAETASGWQEATFASPVAIDANTTYIASYHAPAGYAATVGFFTSAGIDNPPLHALANGVDGVNGIYKYGPSGSFPTDTFQSGNYWVDVTFVKTVGPDTTPPVIQTVTPVNGASSVNPATTVTAKFNEPMDIATINSANFELRDAANTLIPSSVTYDPPTRTAVLTPTDALSLLTVYTATVKIGVKDIAGNALAADYIWNFTTQAPPPDEGPGGPILVITSTSDIFGRYYAEILRAEGLNEFTVTDISNVNATMLANYDVVILAHMSLNDLQATLFTDWVAAGGNLIAMRPDARLASLLGLTSEGTSLANAYLLVNTASGPGAGIVNQSIQYHSDADRYTVNGATVIATLYSDAITSTTNPAVTVVNVGSNGGQAAAFTFDLARSVVYTRQGNPVRQGINGDGSSGPVRADDMFHNGTDPDWVDLTKVAIPQADEQQRLLANMIYSMNLDNKPLPRFWYFPRDEKAVVIMTMDEHGSGDLVTRLNRYNILSPIGCSLNDWECVRSTSYIYTNAQITDAQLAAFQTQGHEFAVHIDTGCANFTPSSLANNYATQTPALKAQFPSINAPLTQRTHCIAFSDWSSQPKVQLQNGMRLDTNYYYWPDTWVLNRPGMFTGSGMPMRFADLDGTLIDVYQATTQMTDESGQTLAVHIDTLLNNAVGAPGYYGVFTANMHTDGGSNASNGAESIIASAQARGVPVVSAEQMLAWLDGRNNSSFSAIDFQNDVLSFHVTAAAGSNGLRAMLPVQGSNGPLTGITRNGLPVTYATLTVKGVQYAFFDALTGDYQASYVPDTVDPVISGVNATVNPDGTVTITWTTDELSASRVDYGTSAGSLTSNVTDAALVTSHTLTLSGLIPNTTYHYRVSSTDASNNTVVSPESPVAPLTFATPAIPLGDDTVADFTAGTLSCNYVSSTSDGELILPPAVGVEFDGTSLPFGWESAPWGAGGTVSVSDGKLNLNYGYARTTDRYTSGRVLEYVATFSNQTISQSEHVGFAEDFNAPLFAAFSTKHPGGADLWARSLTDGTSVETNLGGSYLGSSHLYRIEWYADHIVYFIDGTQVANHTIAISSNMRPVVSDGADTASLTVDWMRMSPFTGPCTFTSRVFDAGSMVNWQALSWTAGLPADTSLAFSYHLGDTSTPDGTWLPFMDVPASGTPISGSARYAQYRVALDTASALVTPNVQDVLFTYSTETDTTAPTITNRVPAVNATNVAIDSSITVTFSEVLASATVNGTSVYLRKFGEVTNVPATVTLVGNLITLDPSASLEKGSTYTVTVKSSIADMANNLLGVDSTWNFTTVPDSVADSTVADFSAGTIAACVVDATIGNGAVRLPLTIDENFLGTTLPAGWASGVWNTGGTASMSDGTLVVDGARGYSNLSFGPGVSLEFRATFTATNFQNIGFTADGDFNAPWIVIGEGSSSNGVYARTDTGDAILLSTTTLGTPHIYRIDWTAGGFAFYVDGTLATTITRAVTGNMVVNISDFNTGGGTLTADWVHVTPYVSPCTFESRVLDAGQFADWLDLSWDGASPTGTTVGFETRSGNSYIPDGDWSVWQSVNSPIASPNGRYIQYRAALGTTDTAQTPVIESVNLTYAAIPEYEVTFDAQGGAPTPAVQSVPIGGLITAPTAPTRTGHTFNGWFNAATGGTQWDFDTGTMPASNLTLYARWTANDYTITFDSNGGSFVAPITQPFGSTVTAPTDPIRAGYTFAGWNPAVPATMPLGGAALTAQWTANDYTITFDSNGGSPVASITQAFGSAVTPPADPTRAGYTFAGWSPAFPATMPLDGASLTAQWTANDYTITFDSDGGTAVASITQAFGSAVTVPTAPTKSGYTFAGWDPAVPATMPLGGASLTAQWTANDYTITFNSDGGSSVDPITQLFGSAITAPADPTKSGYTFAGWSPAVPATMPLDGAALTAQWTVNNYTITFDSNSGSSVADITLPYGSAVTAPAAPTKSGYTFAGWDPAVPATMPLGGATLTALWTANDYTITFDSAGGTAVSSITQAFGSTIAAPADPTRAGYTFAGWDPAFPATMPLGGAALTAQWTANDYALTITVVGNGSVTKTPDQTAYQYGDTVQLSAAPETGWQFSGWSGGASGTTNPVIITLNGNSSVTATFTEIPPVCTGILYVDKDSTAVNPNGCNWTWAFRTLQDALAAAPTNGTTIWVADGMYYPDEGAGQTNNSRTSTFTLENSVSIYGGFAGTETSLAQRNVSLYVTTLSGDIDQVIGNANNAYHVVSGFNLVSSAVLDGFTVTGGNANSDGTGGGLYNQNGSPTLRNLIITANTSSNFGGGMYSITSGSTDSSITSPVLTNVTFSGNTSVRGGGLVTMNSNPVLTDVTFSGNTATGGAGGGMNNQTASTSNPASVPVLTNVTFTNNTANGGGGLYNGNSNPLLTNVTIVGNTANIRGGGILNEGASPVLKNVTISGNTAPAGNGGAIRNVVGVTPANKQSNPLIENSILWGNNGGGGIDDITSDGAGITNISYSVVENGCQPAGSACMNILTGDPVLGVLANNGGLTQTISLGAGSSAIDGGNPNVCTSTDQRGFARPQGLACDIGAYEALTYTLSVSTSGNGTVLTDNPGPYFPGDAVNLTAIPGSGSSFSNWSGACSGTGACLLTMNENKSVTASFALNDYTITFDSNGGTAVASITQAFGSSITAPAAPTKAGYTFAGWDPAFPATMPLNGASLTAQWTVNNYTITFNSDGGTAVASITQAFGSAITAPADPTKSGYTFAGWNPAVPATMPLDGASLTAQWTANDYTITFNSDGGSAVADITQAFGSAVTVPTAPTKSGYTFAGWSPAFPATMPLGGATLTAQWTANDYTITFDSNGGSLVAPITQAFGSAVTVPTAPTKAGYTFAGWSPSVPATMPLNGATLTAQWTANDYTIIFNSDGGSAVADITLPYGSAVTAPTAPTKSGYTFAGWSPAVPATMPLNGATLTAQWTANDYTITFNSAGGTAVASITQAFGSAVTAPAAPTKSGYTFAGWNPAFPATMPLGGASLTAQWTANDYTITFDSNGGTAVSSITQAFGSAITAPAAPTKSGYTFAGWDPAVPATMPLNGVTLTAQWTASQYTLTIVSAHGTVTKTPNKTTYTYGEEVTLSVIPDTGWTFTGWTPELTNDKVTITGETTITANFSVSGITLLDPQGPLTSWNNTFSWTGVTGASWYLVQVQAVDDTVILQKWYSTDNVGCAGDLNCVASPDETLNLANGDYKWRILDYGDGYGYGSWSIYKDFSLNAACYSLTTNILPAGGGTLNASTQNCSGGYLSGTVVQLTAVPNSGYVFAGWSGDTNEISNPVAITMDTNKTVAANFTTVGVVPHTPDGTLTSWSNTFNWTGFDNASWYLVQVQAADDTVILQKWYTAEAAGCSGDLSCVASPDETLNLMNGDYKWRILDYGDYGYGNWSVYKDFALNAACYALTTSVLPVGGGTVTASSQNCSGGYLAGTVVQLTAVVNSGYGFSSWSGDTVGTSNPVFVTMNAEKNITANFTALGATLISPAGALTSWNNTFSWIGVTGASWYLVQVQAVDDTVILQKWYTAEAAGCAGDLNCVASPDETLNLTNGYYKWRILDYGDYGYGNWTPYTIFNMNAACYSLTTNILPAGGGTLNASTQNCSGGYLAGTVVQLTAITDSGYGFSSWSGDVVGTSNPVFVTMNAEKNITANFTALGATLISPAGALTSWDNTFSWMGVTGASWYLVQVQAVDDTVILQKWYTADAAGCPGDLSCVVSPDETLNLTNGDYKWRILDYGDYGYGSWSIYKDFNLNTACYTLSTDVLPAGSGTITASTQNCSGGYISGTVVQVSVVPNSGYAFTGWIGDAIGTSNPVSITMDANKSVTANFTALGVTLITPTGALTSWDNTFSWTGFSNTSWYLVQVLAADDSVILQQWYTADAAGCAGGTACAIVPPETASLVSGDYQWRILDYGDYGYGNWSPYTAFALNR